MTGGLKRPRKTKTQCAKSKVRHCRAALKIGSRSALGGTRYGGVCSSAYAVDHALPPAAGGGEWVGVLFTGRATGRKMLIWARSSRQKPSMVGTAPGLRPLAYAHTCTHTRPTSRHWCWPVPLTVLLLAEAARRGLAHVGFPRSHLQRKVSPAYWFLFLAVGTSVSRNSCSMSATALQQPRAR